MRGFVAVTMILLYGLVAAAQEGWRTVPNFEFSGGYSYLYSGGAQRGYSGFDISGKQNVNRWFGINTDFSAYFGGNSFAVSLPGLSVSGSSNETIFVYGGGPQFTVRNSSRVIPFVRGMFRGSS